MKKEVWVARIGKTYHPWYQAPIKFSGTKEECHEYLKKHLKEGMHGYVDLVEVNNDGNR